MKKFNYLLLGLAGVAMASCSQEDVTAPSQGEGYAITVQLPADLATRAQDTFGQGYVAEKLYVGVYDADNAADDGTLPFVALFEDEFPANSLKTTVYLDLTTGKNYKLAFFAANENAADVETGKVYYYNPSDATITVDYSLMNSEGNLADYYDCFYQSVETGKVSSTNMGQTVILYRPLAQINWGTSDYNEMTSAEEAYGENLQNLQSTFTATVYNTLNLLTKEVSGETEAEIGAFAAPSIQNEAFPVEGYLYAAMQYVLVPAEPDQTYDLNLAMVTTTGVENEDVFVANAPLQANYRTNIYGKLLTNPYELIVEKDPNWNKPDYNLPQDVAWDGTTKTRPEVVGQNIYINQPSDLAGLADLATEYQNGAAIFEGMTIELGGNYDLGAQEFPTIGSFSSDNSTTGGAGLVFCGTFDGKGYTISNLTVKNDTPNSSASFIAAIGGNGTLKNVTFDKVNIQGSATGYSYAGIVGVLQGGTIENVTIESGTITGNFNTAGIVSTATLSQDNVIKDCTNNAKITCSFNSGGIVGTSNAKVSGCVNNGTIDANSGQSIGGVVGEQRCGGSITNCQNNGTIYAAASNVGGIVGWVRYLAANYGYTENFGLIEVSNNTNKGAIQNKVNGLGGGTAGIVGNWYNGGVCSDNTNASGISVSAGNVAGIVGVALTSGTTFNGMVELTIQGNTTNEKGIVGPNAWTILAGGRDNLNVAFIDNDNIQIFQ